MVVLHSAPLLFQLFVINNKQVMHRQRCKIIPDELRTDETVYPSPQSATTISVQAFTPILGTLLLSPNGMVGGAARYAVVDILSRMKKADDREAVHERVEDHASASTYGKFDELEERAHARDEEDSEGEEEGELVVGLFGMRERAMFEQEILQQVVIGMGRLDVEEAGEVFEEDYGYGELVGEGRGESVVNVVTVGEGQDDDENGEDIQVEQLGADLKGTVIGQEEDIPNPYFALLPVLSAPSSAGSVASTPSPSTSTTPSSSSATSSPALPISPPSESPGTSTTSVSTMTDSVPLLPHPPLVVPLPRPHPNIPIHIANPDYTLTSHPSTQSQSQTYLESQPSQQPPPYPPDLNRSNIHSSCGGNAPPLEASPSDIEMKRPSSDPRELNPRAVAEIQPALESSPDHWIPPAPRPSHAMLPPPRHPAQLELASTGPTHAMSPIINAGGRSIFHVGAGGSGDGYEEGQTYGEGMGGDVDETEGEQAAVGRLSSMSLMAAVTASGTFASAKLSSRTLD